MTKIPLTEWLAGIAGAFLVFALLVAF